MSKEYDPLFGGSPLGMELISYLQNRDRVPPIRRAFLGDATSGEFRYPNTDRGMPKGMIVMSHGAGPSTLVHELAHAADLELLRQYYGDKTAWGVPSRETQFTDAFEKLRGTVARARDQEGYFKVRSHVDRRQQLAEKLDPKWTEKNANYRASHNELGGWAAGSTVQPDMEYKRPHHLDPTIATELSILLDLAKRGEQEKPKQSFLDKLFGMFK